MDPDIDIEQLSDEAVQMGIVTKEQVIAHLESFIKSAASYRARRRKRGIERAYDHLLSLHALAAARAIWLLQGEENK
jgi:hypothetical protein